MNSLLEMLEMYSLRFYSKKNEKFSAPKYEPDEELKQKDKILEDKYRQIE